MQRTGEQCSSLHYGEPNVTEVSILVIEDNEDDKELIEDLMRSSGANCNWKTVHYAEDGRDLLKLDEATYDLVFVDVGLPRMSGLELIKEFEENQHFGKKAPAIFVMSGSINPRDRQAAEAFGSVRGYLSKPIRKEDIVTAIGSVADEVS